MDHSERLTAASPYEKGTVEIKPTEEYVPETRSLEKLRDAAESCHGCPLYQDATQVVFGEGPRTAKLMLIGEQPGDQEDKSGHPFVGPAGRVLRQAISDAGLDEDAVYITNAVKHFKWKPSGGRRLHAKPTRRERLACLPWLEAEIKAVKPAALMCLGATASQTVFGDDFRLTKHTGEILDSPYGIPAITSLHPSAILRMRGDEEKEEAREQLVKDLRQIQSRAG